jgi:hypothetical protein
MILIGYVKGSYTFTLSMRATRGGISLFAQLKYGTSLFLFDQISNCIDINILVGKWNDHLDCDDKS